MFVEDRDLDPTEPRWKSLQMSASSSRPHRIDDLHSTLRRASKASLQERLHPASSLVVDLTPAAVGSDLQPG